MTRQCRILPLARSTAYYAPAPISAEELARMRRIDEPHLEHSFAGVRMLHDMLNREGHRIGRRHARTLMNKMGIEALYRKPNTSQRQATHPLYPYLFRGLTIDRTNQVWATDITYIPMRRGFVYRVAVMDWATRRVLSWRVSNTLTTDFCLDAVREAIARYGCPEIFNTTKAASSSAANLSDCSSNTVSKSVGMARVAGAITSSSSGYRISRLTARRRMRFTTTTCSRKNSRHNTARLHLSTPIFCLNKWGRPLIICARVSPK